MIIAILYAYLFVTWLAMVVCTVAWSEGVISFENVFFYSAAWPYALALWITGNE